MERNCKPRVVQQKRAHLTDDFAYDIMFVATSSKVSGNYIKYAEK